VDAPTYLLAGGAIGFASTGEHRLKGKAEAQELLRATRVLSAVGGAQRVDGLEALLTGRDAELCTIKDLFPAAGRRRAPRHAGDKPRVRPLGVAAGRTHRP
jgi:hypothetical protein